jgi:hypothetical protein
VGYDVIRFCKALTDQAMMRDAESSDTSGTSALSFMGVRVFVHGALFVAADSVKQQIQDMEGPVLTPAAFDFGDGAD